MMKTLNIRAMVEGAILAALTVIMGVFYWIPGLSIITFFWSVPIILVGYRHGFKVSIISSVVAALILSMMMNPVMGLILLMVYALPGAVIGFMLRKKLSPYIVIFIGGLIMAVASLLEFALTMDIVSGKNVFDVIFNLGAEIDNYYNYFYISIAKSTEMYSKLGIGEEKIKELLEVVKMAIYSAKRILPTSFALIGIFIAYANFKVVRLILNKLGYVIEDIKEFIKWRLRDEWIVPSLILTASTFFLNYVKIEWVKIISENLLMLLFTVYGVLGLSVIIYFLKSISAKYEIPKTLQVGIILFILFTLFSILPFIGMIDMTADLRQFSRKTVGGAK